MNDDDWYFDNRSGTPDPAWPVVIVWLLLLTVVVSAACGVVVKVT